MSSQTSIRAYHTDSGDKDITQSIALNICLVPDPASAAAMQYRTQLTQASQDLALQRNFKSCYVLNSLPGKTSALDSHVHATVTHVVMHNPLQTWARLADVITSRVGTKGNLIVTGLQAFKGGPFDRLRKITEGARSRLPEGTKDRVAWAAINSSDFLREIKTVIHKDVSAAAGHDLLCVTGEENQYLPHHTMYVERIDSSNAGIKNFIYPWADVPEFVEIPHILAIADCGPWGQVRRFETDPNKIHAFIQGIALG